MVADHSVLVAETAVLKVLFYFGTVVELFKENIVMSPEYMNMFRTLLTAVNLDPYNDDAYYFAQAAFTWELGRIREVNEMLEIGARSRTWDPWINFYLGFNHAYFLKDYPTGAKYFKRAAELSGNPLYANLAARYFYESRQTELGLSFLDTMIAQAKDSAVKETYQLRRNALIATMQLEHAIDIYQKKYGRNIKSFDELTSSGLISTIPKDPYGGTFYLDEDGRVRSTSKFAETRQ